MEGSIAIGAVVLAAGKGVRMRSERPKTMQEILGEPLLFYSLSAVASAGIGASAVVVGHKGAHISSYVNDACPDSAISWQHEQLGTGHALRIAREWWISFSHVLVLPGDVPMISSHSLSLLVDRHLSRNAACTFISFSTGNPFGYGRVVRDGTSCRIVEAKDADENQKRITEVNSGVYIFNVSALDSVIGLLSNENAQGEYYLPDIMKLLSDRELRVEAILAESETEFAGINSARQLSEVASYLRRNIVERWLENGVRFHSPETAFIGPKVTMGTDVEISPFVQIYGDSVLADGVHVGSGTVIRGSVLENGATIFDHVVLEKCHISSRAKIGPFAYLRDGTRVASDAYVGKFVEMKKSFVGERSKVPHLSYIGDAQIGEDTNVGAGTITCNYDGVRKNPTKIGNRCFIGSDTMLVAPVELGDDAFTGAGSVITQNVPEGDLAVARARQRNISGWGKKKNSRTIEGAD